MKHIEVKSLSKEFAMGAVKTQVLKALDFTVDQGSFVSIMGPSGSGKSTLLYLLGGLDQPSGGHVMFNDKDLGKLKEKEMSKIRRRDIGFVFQFYNLVPNLTVEENILLPLALDKKSLKAYEMKLDELLETVGLTDKKNHKPSQLSGGQQQRVAIARALIFEPQVLLLDEPVGNLDSKTAKEIMDLFQKIHVDLKKTIIQVTHSNEFAKYGDRIMHIKDGAIFSDELKSSQVFGRIESIQ